MEHVPLSADDLEPFAEPLLEAVRVGDVAALDAALAKDPRSIGAHSHAYAYDALGLALAMGKLALAAHLLDRGADPNSWEANDATPLSAALGLPPTLRTAALDLLAARGVNARACDRSAAAEVGSLAIFDRVRSLPRSTDGDDDDGNDELTDRELHASMLAAAARKDDALAMTAILAADPELAKDASLFARTFEAAAEFGGVAAWEWLAPFPLPDLRRLVPALVRRHRSGDRARALAMFDEVVVRAPDAADRLLVDGASVVELEEHALARGADPSRRGAPHAAHAPPSSGDGAAARRTSDLFLVAWGTAWGLVIVFVIVVGVALFEWAFGER